MSGIGIKNKIISNKSTVQENEPININDLRENIVIQETPNISNRPLTSYYAQKTTSEVQGTNEVLRLPVRDHAQINNLNTTTHELIEQARMEARNRTNNGFSRRNNLEDKKALDQARKEEFEQKLTEVDEQLEERQSSEDAFNNQTTAMGQAHTNTREAIKIAEDAPINVAETGRGPLRTLVNFVMENPLQVGIATAIGTLILGGAYFYFRNNNNTETTVAQRVGEGLATTGVAAGTGLAATAMAGGSFSNKKQENNGLINVNFNNEKK